MQTLYPDYYAQFRCTADKCPITCCQEWKISVDDDTLKRWAALNPPVIALNSRHVCPFLEKNKLCRLVLEHGENAISETCQIFPRETHSFADHEEASLMPCCPAVIDLWAAQDAAPLTFRVRILTAYHFSSVLQSSTPFCSRPTGCRSRFFPPVFI